MKEANGMSGFQKTSVLMVAFVLLCSLASFQFAAVLSEREFVEQAAQIEASNRNMAMVLAESVTNAVRQADILLLFIKSEWEEKGAISQEQRKVINETLNVGMINRINVSNAAGEIVFGVVPLPGPVNVGRWDQFLTHREKDTGEVLASSANTAGTDGQPTLFISRRLNRADGSFAGIVSVGIRQNFLLRVFQMMNLGEDHSLGLLHRNGSMLALVPGGYDRASVEANIKNHPTLELAQAGFLTEKYEIVGADGLERLGSFRTIFGYPLIATATIKKEAAFREVDSRRILYRNAAVAVTLIITVAVLLMWLQLRKQYRTEKTLRNRETDLRYASYHDPLTGIYNRAYFYEKFQNAGAPVAVIMADLDGLKVLNDTFGHKMGDIALRKVARILVGSIPVNAVAARIGGDEFAVLLPRATRGDAESAYQSIRRAIDMYNDGNVLPLQLSIGFAVSGPTGTMPEDLLATADKWMYREKLRQAGSHRNQFTNTMKEMLVARDDITGGHVSRVMEMTVGLALAAGLPERQIPDLELFANFHDIGKVGVSDLILNKRGPLTPRERHEMQQHSEIGHRIASATDDLAGVAEWILQHHERWDGKGYPLGSSEEEIPIQCRILAIADAYDAMTSDRPYRKAMPRAAAIKELRRHVGTQFDPDLVEKFIALLMEKDPSA